MAVSSTLPSAWVVQLEHLPVLEKVIARGVISEFPRSGAEQIRKSVFDP